VAGNTTRGGLAGGLRVGGDSGFVNGFIGLRHPASRTLADAADNRGYNDGDQSEKNNVLDYALSTPSGVMGFHGFFRYRRTVPQGTRCEVR
jgi:hypothetical protein